MKILSILFLSIILLSACSLDGEPNSQQVNNRLVEIEETVKEIEAAVSELETELAELLTEESVMERLESMTIELDGRNYISMDDISTDRDLGDILSRANALDMRAFEILAIDIPAYVEAHPDSYDDSCGNTEQSTPECFPGQLQIQLEYLRHERLRNLFPFDMTVG